MSKKQVADTATYTREELIAGAAAFGVRPEVMAGALRLAGLTQATRSQAEEAIKRFKERRV